MCTASDLVAGVYVPVGSNVVCAIACVILVFIIIDKHLDVTAEVSRTISTIHSIYVTPVKTIVTRHNRTVNAMVTSRLDYCNSVLFGTSLGPVNILSRFV